jgi:hypothetical protein
MESALIVNFQKPSISMPCDVSHGRPQLVLARAYYHLRDFDSSKQYYSKVSDAFLDKCDHFMIAMNLAHKCAWKDSFLKFSNFDLSTILSACTKEEVLLIIEVILRETHKKIVITQPRLRQYESLPLR